MSWSKKRSHSPDAFFAPRFRCSQTCGGFPRKVRNFAPEFLAISAVRSELSLSAIMTSILFFGYFCNSIPFKQIGNIFFEFFVGMMIETLGILFISYAVFCLKKKQLFKSARRL